jgi:hypothetical protein
MVALSYAAQQDLGSKCAHPEMFIAALWRSAELFIPSTPGFGVSLFKARSALVNLSTSAEAEETSFSLQRGEQGEYQ